MKNIIVTLIALFAVTANATTITGAGATFPAPVYFKWADGYKKATGNEVNYQSIGSSGGLKQIDSRTVNFGASDAARSQKDLDERGQIQFPMVMGGVVPVVNIEGVGANQVNMTHEMLAKIFAGKVVNWNQVDKNLPSLPITLVVRSDGSGTTHVFTTYLASVSPEFEKTVGAGKTVNWQGSNIGGKGNAGVAAMLTQLKGSIGYVEYAYAKQNKLVTAKIDGVAPSLDTFKSKEWPLTAETYIILYPTADVKDVIKFFDWCYSQDKAALDLDYVPLSDKSKKETRDLWKKNKL